MGLSDDAVERIKQMLIDGELQPGQRLPVEKELAARLGVSRNSLREAVRALTTIRVLQTRQGDGTYVTSLSPELLLDTMSFVVDLHHDATVLQFFEVRRLLEPEAAAMAAGSITDAGLAELDGLLTRAEEMAAAEPVDHEKLVDNDQAFHGLINRSCGNPVLATVIEGMSGATTRARVWRGITEESAARRTVAEHRLIYTALANRDAARARLYAAVHIAGVEDWLRGVL
jgi:GntR family transcriptional repressor for pyruvate dehydrogenase complex